MDVEGHSQIRGNLAINQLSGQTCLSKWKSDFIENALDHMRSPSERPIQEANREVEKLYEKKGRLQMENDYLKKRLI